MVGIKKSKGFTLIELSIVIVIIGLIVAGVVGGQALVKQSKMRAVISEQNQTKLALNAFRLEYDAIPGDFVTAASYWGGAVNGDGDKQIEILSVNGAIESYSAWQHLALADLHPGSFTPSNATAVVNSDMNVKVPASKFTGAVLTMVYDNSATYAAGHVTNTVGASLSGNALVVGGVSAANGGVANAAIFDAKDVQGIDDKIDDGGVDTGIVVGLGSSGTGAGDCIDTAPTPDSYNLDGNEKICAVAFGL